MDVPYFPILFLEIVDARNILEMYILSPDCCIAVTGSRKDDTISHWQLVLQTYFRC
jgi:hypothetical protein